MPCLRSLLLATVPAARAAEGARAPGTTFTDCDGCPLMIVIPAGSFVMGTPGAVAARGAGAAEVQAFVVGIPRPFALGRFEVTRGEYARFVADSGYEPRAGCRVWDPALARFNEDPRRGWQDVATPSSPGDDFPVTCVSFTDAQAYVQWLSGKDRCALPAAVRGRVGIRRAGRKSGPAAVG